MNLKQITFFCFLALFFGIYSYLTLKALDKFIKPKNKPFNGTILGILISFSSALISSIYSTISALNVTLSYSSHSIALEIFNDSYIQVIIDSFSNINPSSSSGIYNMINTSVLNIILGFGFVFLADKLDLKISKLVKCISYFIMTTSLYSLFMFTITSSTSIIRFRYTFILIIGLTLITIYLTLFNIYKVIVGKKSIGFKKA